MTKLLNCPFCNGLPESRLYDCEYFVQCVECFNSTAADHQAEEDAVAAWNRRAQDFDAMRERAEKAEAIARELRTSADCSGLHHKKSERHELGEACKVLERIDAALAQQAKP